MNVSNLLKPDRFEHKTPETEILEKVCLGKISFAEYFVNITCEMNFKIDYLLKHAHCPKQRIKPESMLTFYFQIHQPQYLLT